MKKLPLLLILLFLFVFSTSTFAAFSGGINIGDHYSEFDTAVQTGSGWVYVIMNPDNASQLSAWLNKYPNLQIIVRGHLPDQQGSSLTQEYAQRWANVFKDLPRAIYFMPVNEPNNPNESAGGILATTVTSYINSLTDAINKTQGAKEKVFLLSPAIDVYTLSDKGPSHINELGGWSFFQQFYGIALNLYGEYAGNSINSNALAIKRGEGYREFLKSHFGANDVQAASARIFAVETGVKKVGEIVKYRENTVEIVDYMNRMRNVWGSDPNFIMHAIFSYDPAEDRTPWIYNQTAVLTAMGLSGGTSVVAIPTPTPPDFQKEHEITKNTNERLLPKTIQDAKKEKEESCSGQGGIIQIGPICVKNPFISDNEYKGRLAAETEYFQPTFVTSEKRKSVCSWFLQCVWESITGGIAEIFRKGVPPQVEVKETGNLNFVRPKGLEFYQFNNQTVQGNPNQNVLASTIAPQTEEERVKDAYKFAQKMLLPQSLEAVIAGGIPDVGVPTPTLSTGVTPTPTSIIPTPTGPHYGSCREGSGYCSVSYLMQFFPNRNIAQQASVICNRESGSNPFAANKGCLTGRYLDYSIGLFQINLLAHCPGAFSNYTRNPITCTIADRNKLKACETRLYNPDENIREAVRISSNGTNWRPWSAASVCGIVP